MASYEKSLLYFWYIRYFAIALVAINPPNQATTLALQSDDMPTRVVCLLKTKLRGFSRLIRNLSNKLLLDMNFLHDIYASLT
jgi:hypothetical protein